MIFAFVLQTILVVLYVLARIANEASEAAVYCVGVVVSGAQMAMARVKTK